MLNKSLISILSLPIKIGCLYLLTNLIGIDVAVMLQRNKKNRWEKMFEHVALLAKKDM